MDGMLVPPLLVLLLLLVGASFSAGRFGDDEVPLGLMEDGGVTELWEDVSRVEEDWPEITSPLDCDSLDLVSLDMKLALERRRKLKKGMVAEVSPMD